MTRPAGAGGFQDTTYPEARLRLKLPRDWIPVAVHPPLVALRTSGPAVISLWRYRQSAPAPSGASQLHGALLRLVAAARRRNHSLRVVGSSTGSVDGYPALELETVQRIGKAMRQVQSTHVFFPGQEVVLEEYSPVDLFPALNRSIFSAIRQSLTALGR